MIYWKNIKMKYKYVWHLNPWCPTIPQGAGRAALHLSNTCILTTRCMPPAETAEGATQPNVTNFTASLKGKRKSFNFDFEFLIYSPNVAKAQALAT